MGHRTPKPRMNTRTDTPAPLRRRGPRPLLLHLTLAMLRSTVSRATSPSLNPASPNSSTAFAAAAAAIAEVLRNPTRADNAAEAFPRAVVEETLRQDADLIGGIAAYRRHPYSRMLQDPAVVWAEGETRLLDYGALHQAASDDRGSYSATPKPADEGVPALFVPSLVNRAYVLDLLPGHSMLRWLAGQGIRPLLLDWGWPTEVERRFTLTDYVAGRLERAMEAAARTAGGRPALVGYCMGGTLAVAAAARRPGLLRGLGLLAAPWDFHAADRAQGMSDTAGATPSGGMMQSQKLASILPLFEPALAFNQTLPVDLLQVLFAMLDPWGVADKYRGFAKLDQDSARARLFVALEDWLNDGVPLAAPVARECIAGWYGENSPALGTWRIAGMPVDPTAIRLPTFVAAPARDRIVPPESARPLAGLIPGAVLHEPAAGHIGMAAGGTAERVLWRPLRDWLVALPEVARPFV
jgi:polyhydroxyalkanoate synthase subunit PhaC